MLASGNGRWQHAPPVEEIFQRKKRRRRPFARAGGLLFAVLAIASLVEAIRAAPFEVGGGAQVSGVEAILYRVAAAFFCTGLSLWLLLGQRRRRDEADRLLR